MTSANDTVQPAPDPKEILEGVKEFQVSDLINRDPLGWTPMEETALVQYYRQRRHTFAQEEAAAKSSGRATRSAKAKGDGKLVVPAADVKLEDLL